MLVYLKSTKMRLMLAIITLTQFRGSDQLSEVSNFATQYRPPQGMYGIRQMSNDQADSIKSDRINSFQDEQIPLRPQDPSTPPRTQNVYQPVRQQQFTSPQQSRIIPKQAGQEYAEYQRGQDYYAPRDYQTMHAPQGPTESYQNYASSAMPPPLRGYQPQLNYRSAETYPNERSEYMPRQQDYRSYNEIPHSGPMSAPYPSAYQMRPQNYHDRQDYMQRPQQSYPGPNEDGRQHYMQSGWKSPPQGYEVVNRNSEPGVSISLPGNEETTPDGYSSQRQPQRFLDGYQVVNEGPVEYMVTSITPAGSYQSIQKGPVNYNAQPRVDYMPDENAYYPPQGAADGGSGGQQYRQSQSQNEVYPSSSSYGSSYMSQDQQREMHYDMWKSQQAPMPMPMPMSMSYAEDSKDTQNKYLDMVASQLTRQTRRTSSKTT